MQRSAHMKLPRRPGLSSLNVAAALYLSSNPTRMALGYPARQSGLHPNSGMVFSISQTRFTCMTGPPCEQVQPHQRRFGSVAPLQRDTIYALATAPGKAGVAIIRISGPAAADVYERMVFPPRKKGGAPIRGLPPERKLVLRDVRHPHTGELLDQAAVVWFGEGRSYTTETTLELHLHGGPSIVRDMLDALSALSRKPPSIQPSLTLLQQPPGQFPAVSLPALHSAPLALRPATAGEYTRRAFQGGRLDLTAVEALGSLIQAETTAQRRLALRGVGGAQRVAYETMRGELLRAMSYCEASIDFSDEEGVEADSFSHVLTATLDLRARIAAHLGIERDGAGKGRERRGAAEIVTEGIRLAIFGPPNAGKSSLLNALADREAAIVSPTPGTTRDVLELTLDIDGYKVVVADTAGLRQVSGDGQDARGSSPHDLDIDGGHGHIERIGIERARKAVEAADLALFICPLPSHLTDIKELLLPSLTSGAPFDTDKPVLIFLNKSDLVSSSSSSSPSPSTPSSADNETAQAISAVRSTVLSALAGASNARNITTLTTDQKIQDQGEEKPNIHIWTGSMLTGQGMDTLIAGLGTIIQQRFAQALDSQTETPMITQARHRHHLAQAMECLDRFFALPLVRAHQARAQASGGPPSPSAELEFDPDDEELDLDSDLVLAAEELRGAATALGNVTGLAAGAGPGSGAGAGVGMGAGMGMGTMGAVRVEEVLGEIFGRFCIGK